MSNSSEENDDLQLDQEQNPLADLLVKVKRQQIMLLVLAILCISSLAVAVALPLVRSPKGQELLRSDIAEIEAQLISLNEQVAFGLENTRQTVDKLEALDAKVATMDLASETNAIVRLQRILVRQEQDYRDFLATLEQGMYALHLMVPHSRAWWDEYKASIDDIVNLSRARENYVINLRNN